MRFTVYYAANSQHEALMNRLAVMMTHGPKIDPIKIPRLLGRKNLTQKPELIILIYTTIAVLLIEKVHLDDLDLYVITFIALATSVLL